MFLQYWLYNILFVGVTHSDGCLTSPTLLFSLKGHILIISFFRCDGGTVFLPSNSCVRYFPQPVLTLVNV